MAPFDQGGGESPQDDRNARLQHQELARVVGNRPPMPDVGQTIALQVYDGGSIPTSGDKYFLGHPVYYGSDQCEGCHADPVADTNVSIPFVVLGADIPTVGDVVDAHSAGGRWVAQLGVSQDQPDCLMALCGSCNIPKTDLTVAWTNPILGDGSTTLAYSNGTWISGCSNELIYQLSCTSNQVEFRAIYFISARCPDGTRQYCSNLRASQHGLTVTKLACGNNFEMDMTCGDACPILQTNGFTSFKVTATSTAGQPIPRCRVCFTVACSSTKDKSGISVNVSGGPGSGGSGTTNEFGFVAIDIGKSGTYSVAVSGGPCLYNFKLTLKLECGKSYYLGDCCCVTTVCAGVDCLTGSGLAGVTMRFHPVDGGEDITLTTGGDGCASIPGVAGIFDATFTLGQSTCTQRVGLGSCFSQNVVSYQRLAVVDCLGNPMTAETATFVVADDGTFTSQASGFTQPVCTYSLQFKTITVSADRFATGVAGIDLLPVGGIPCNAMGYLQTAPGYACDCGCPLPVSTLNATTSVCGGAVLTLGFPPAEWPFETSFAWYGTGGGCIVGGTACGPTIWHYSCGNLTVACSVGGGFLIYQWQQPAITSWACDPLMIEWQCPPGGIFTGLPGCPADSTAMVTGT